jgi:hypothetical protein
MGRRQREGGGIRGEGLELCAWLLYCLGDAQPQPQSRVECKRAQGQHIGGVCAGAVTQDRAQSKDAHMGVQGAALSNPTRVPHNAPMGNSPTGKVCSLSRV